MTSPLLRIRNPAGGLVLSAASSFGLNYVGMAAPYSIVQASGSATSPGGRIAGQSKYRVTSINRPVVFVELLADTTVRLASIVNLGSNVWEVTVYAGTTPSDADSFETQVYVGVWCFAQPVSHVGVGLRINDDAGNLRWSVTDLSGRLLTLKGSFDLAGSAPELDGDTSIPSLTRPAVIGMPQSWGQNSSPAGAFDDCRLLRYGWRRVASTTVRQASFFSRKFRNDGGLSTVSESNASTAILIDAANY